MRGLIFLLLLLLTTNSYAVEEDTILSCSMFETSFWDVTSWFDDTKSRLQELCENIAEGPGTTQEKKNEILRMLNPNINTFDYSIVEEWNGELEEEVVQQSIPKYNKTLIENASFAFLVLDPSVEIADQQNTLIIPYNTTAKVYYNYDVAIPGFEESDKYPDFTPKGFCKEEYSLSYDKGQFDLFIDNNKKIGNDLGTEIQLELEEQGEHSLDGLYNIEVGIQAEYTQWRSYCCKQNDQGACTKYCYECDEFYNSEIIVDQLILTDHKNVSIEQGIIAIPEVNTSGLNEKITISFTIPGLNFFQKYNFNNWFIMPNYQSKLTYLYPPANFLKLLAIKNEDPIYKDPFVDIIDETIYFKTVEEISNVSFEYNGFFFKNNITIPIEYKRVTDVGGYFDEFWVGHEDNMTFYPYIYRERNRCENCSILISDVIVTYNNKSEIIESNSIGKESSVSFIYDKKGSNCILVKFQGDEDHYASESCVTIPNEPEVITILKHFYLTFIVLTAFVFLLKKIRARKEND